VTASNPKRFSIAFQQVQQQLIAFIEMVTPYSKDLTISTFEAQTATSWENNIRNWTFKPSFH